MADRSVIISSEFADFDYDMVIDDLSVWEFIDASSSSEDDVDFDQEEDDFSIAEEGEEEEDEDQTVEPTKEEEEGPVEIVGSPSSDISVEMEPLSPDIGGVVVTAGVVVAAVVDDDVDDYGGNHVDDDEEDDYDDYNDGYDLDDELVPWGFSKKFGKQRISKLAAKRASPKIKGSKKLVYRCAHGKHGISGLQHRYSS
ncbi:OLC1v1002277C1 [Oldenlandia corymbosa var. corymbosa]|uniref:OLC1v1002277C1 n=1 Tax=Oldenlandia corymbosa var. corymbosa TaxID=529605 RepID=A0AAV1D7A5_OLDCO|nr:OLC1v1002277C1 [Oldenlandia corymbosa var. corymbosa]